MSLEFLKNFHRKRVQLLADSGPDLIAFETVPNKLEAQVMAKLMRIFGKPVSIFSYCCMFIKKRELF